MNARLVLPALMLALAFTLAAEARAVRPLVELTGESGAEIIVETNPEGARLYLNDSLVGETPFSQAKMSVGNYAVRVEKIGYRSREFTLNAMSGKRYTFNFDLEKASARLNLSARPSTARLSIDGSSAEPGSRELSAGRHSLRAELFGYQAAQRDVWLEDGSDSRVELELQTAAFSAGDFRLSRQSLNPLASGKLGMVSLSFWVSAPGSGELAVTDSGGAPRRHVSFPSFSTWNQSCSWDGRDDSGSIVPDGRYFIEISLAGADGNSASRKFEVAIDSHLTARAGVSFSGATGLACSPSANTLAPWLKEVSLASAFPLGDDLSSSALPFWLGGRLGFPHDLEAALSLYDSLREGKTDDFVGAAQAKWRYLSTPNFTVAVFLAGAYSALGGSSDYAMASLGSGLRVGNPAALSAGPVSFSVTPLLALSFPASADAIFTLGGSGSLGLHLSPIDIDLSAEYLYGPRLAVDDQPSPRAALEVRYTEPASLFSGMVGIEADFPPGATPSVKALASLGIIF
jgi:hypothetical protein